MRRSLAAALVLTSAALGIWTLAEWVQPADDATATASAAPRPLPPPGATAVHDDRRRAEAVATILARPLFNPGRRPKGEAGAAPSASAAATLPRMTAILIDGDARSAIFDADGKPTVLTEGGHIGPFVIQRIDPLQVTIIGPEGKRVVRTSFAATPPPVAAPPGLQPTFPPGFMPAVPQAGIVPIVPTRGVTALPNNGTPR